ncbi:hypothetical protein JOD82_001905 [Paenibacillus sp. 1182]|uniref:hypothetical protein n=1 Tax=Paenibacillus sp. 1182 TaxID=2806565 RepID=UPI001AEA63C0|nr:hypothetical protein [Paenibacillus sp. 1182]MBP1308885.1 hypothetical protein [Paenibacillus sp. 1182]
MDVIHVELYGGKGLFGGREQPLEASVIRCDKYKSCSYYENNQCLKVRSIGGSTCRFGQEDTVRGYTSKAKKYHQFKRSWKDHEQYRKLGKPSAKLGHIDNFVVFPYPYIHIKEQEDGEIKISDPLLFSDKTAFIPWDKFTPELIHRICSFRPEAVMGGEIMEYRRKIVPMFIAHLKEVIPEKYDEFIANHAEFDVKMDYVGRTALLRTIKPSLVHYESNNYPELNEEWMWDGEYLTFKAGHIHKFNITSNYTVEEVKIKPSDKSTIKISSNDQVTSKTVFID